MAYRHVRLGGYLHTNPNPGKPNRPFFLCVCYRRRRRAGGEERAARLAAFRRRAHAAVLRRWQLAHTAWRLERHVSPPSQTSTTWSMSVVSGCRGSSHMLHRWPWRCITRNRSDAVGRVRRRGAAGAGLETRFFRCSPGPARGPLPASPGPSRGPSRGPWPASRGPSGRSPGTRSHHGSLPHRWALSHNRASSGRWRTPRPSRGLRRRPDMAVFSPPVPNNQNIAKWNH